MLKAGGPRTTDTPALTVITGGGDGAHCFDVPR